MKKQMTYLWVGVMLALLLLPYPSYYVLCYFIEGQDYATAKAVLYDEKPLLTWESITSYPEDYDTWMINYIPYHSALLQAQLLGYYYLLGGESYLDQVIVGKEGWYFYDSESGGEATDSIADYQGTNLYSEEQLAQIKEKLVALRDELEAQDKELVVFIAPNKEQVYSEYMSARYGQAAEVTRAKQVVAYLEDEITIIYPLDELLEAKDLYPEYTFYFKGDTHWNSLGAYVGASIIGEKLGISLPEISSLSMTTKKNGGVDLLKMIGLQNIVDSGYNYAIAGYGEGEFYTEYGTYSYVSGNIDGDERTVLLIGDSFAMALTPVLTSVFKECWVGPWKELTLSNLEESDADIVLLETVERGLHKLLKVEIE